MLKQRIETLELSRKTGQSPYLIHHRREIPDSSAIIEYLAGLRGIEIDEGLSSVQKAISRAFMRMLDEAFCWFVNMGVVTKRAMRV